MTNKSRGLRDWSIITGGGGGLQNGRGNVKFYPYEKGAEKVLAMLKGGGGHNKFWGSFFYMVA